MRIAATAVLAAAMLAVWSPTTAMAQESAAARAAREEALRSGAAAREGGREATAAAREAGRQAAASREEIASAQAELREAQRELERLSERIAMLARRSAAGEIERAFARPAFSRAGLGIVMSPAEDGVRLAGVTPGSPAAQAGLRSGDAIVSIDGKALRGSGQEALARATELIGTLEEGERVRLGYRRGDQSREVELAAAPLPGLAWVRDVAVASAASAAARASVAPAFRFEIGDVSPFAACSGGDCEFEWLSQALRWRGLRLAEVDPQLGRYFGVDRGVLVLKADGEGMEALQPGDVLLRVGGTAVDAPSRAMRELGRVRGGGEVEVLVQRDRKARELTLVVPELSHWEMVVPPTPPAPPAAPAPPAPPRPARPPAAPPSPAAPPAPPAPRSGRDDGGVLDRVLR